MKARLKRKRRALRKKHRQDDFTYWIMWGKTRRPELAKPMTLKQERFLAKAMRWYKRQPKEDDFLKDFISQTPQRETYFLNGEERPMSELPSHDADGDLLTHYFDQDYNLTGSSKYF